MASSDSYIDESESSAFFGNRCASGITDVDKDTDSEMHRTSRRSSSLTKKASRVKTEKSSPSKTKRKNVKRKWTSVKGESPEGEFPAKHRTVRKETDCIIGGDPSGVEGESDWNKQEQDEMVKIRQEISDMPFHKVQKLQEKLGAKVFAQIMNSNSSTPKLVECKHAKTKNTFQRGKRIESKHRPTEMSSKVATPVVRSSVPAKKKISRDPRFEELSGTYNEDFHKQAYGFIDDVKQREKEELMELLQTEEDEEERTKIHALLKRIDQQEKSEKQRKAHKEKHKQWKSYEREQVQKGKTPFFLKKSEKRKLELADKFKELKKSGKVDNYLRKKRKKISSKEKRKLPRSTT